MNTVEVLRAARALIEKGWCQGAWAFNKKKESRAPGSTDAICFCLDAAIWRTDCSVWQHTIAVRKICKTIGLEPYPRLLRDWNDAPERTQAEVLKALDDTIARLEAK